MKIKSALMLLAATTAFVSCSKSEVEVPASGGANEIALRSSVIDVNTRTPYEGTDLSANPLKALVLASLVTGNYADLYCYGYMNFDGTTTGTPFSKPVLGGTYTYPGAGTNVYLTGLYPSAGWSTFGGTTASPTTPGSLEFTLTGKDDVMVAPQVSTNLNAVNAATPTYANLAFTHQLTLMRLSFSGDTESQANVVINSVELSQVSEGDIPTLATVTLAATPSFTFTGTASALACYGTDSDVAYAGQTYALTATATEQAYVIAPPVTASSTDDTFEYTFKIVYTDSTTGTAVVKSRTVSVDLKQNNTTAFAGSTIGTAFNITFKFVAGQIVSNASVTDWVLGGTFDQEV